MILGKAKQVFCMQDILLKANCSNCKWSSLVVGSKSHSRKDLQEAVTSIEVHISFSIREKLLFPWKNWEFFLKEGLYTESAFSEYLIRQL